MSWILFIQLAMLFVLAGVIVGAIISSVMDQIIVKTQIEKGVWVPRKENKHA